MMSARVVSFRVEQQKVTNYITQWWNIVYLQHLGKMYETSQRYLRTSSGRRSTLPNTLDLVTCLSRQFLKVTT
uniref:Alternative protein UTRN n=1 Tax=Homo sapiens TaxID=9606 RepID=L8EAK5_HUMAN|nr:alternative protein UTRN [Homo sapiens]